MSTSEWVTDEAIARFIDKIELGEGGCWLWTASTNADGYGWFSFGGSMNGAHRFAYLMQHGSFKPGMVIDHLCHVRNCVNPDHLRQVTQERNAQNRAGADMRSSTGVRGVSLKPWGKYQAQAKHHGKMHYFGMHDTIEAASKAAEDGRKSLFEQEVSE